MQSHLSRIAVSYTVNGAVTGVCISARAACSHIWGQRAETRVKGSGNLLSLRAVAKLSSPAPPPGGPEGCGNFHPCVSDTGSPLSPRLQQPQELGVHLGHFRTRGMRRCSSANESRVLPPPPHPRLHFFPRPGCRIVRASIKNALMSAVFQGDTHYFHKLKNNITLNEVLNSGVKKKPAPKNRSLVWGFQRGK